MKNILKLLIHSVWPLALSSFAGDGASDGYELVWADEFNQDGRPNPENWVFEHGFVRNRELQWYQPENAFVQDGKLIIEARRERRPNPNHDPESANWKERREHIEYTSACLKTMGLHRWQYGRFEVRAKIRTEAGLWPAIWFLGVEGEWPSSGENGGDPSGTAFPSRYEIDYVRVYQKISTGGSRASSP
jgi:beta-glucanase (GH16 family)